MPNNKLITAHCLTWMNDNILLVHYSKKLNQTTIHVGFCWDQRKTVVRHYKNGVTRLEATTCNIQVFNLSKSFILEWSSIWGGDKFSQELAFSNLNVCQVLINLLFFVGCGVF